MRSESRRSRDSETRARASSSRIGRPAAMAKTVFLSIALFAVLCGKPVRTAASVGVKEQALLHEERARWRRSNGRPARRGGPAIPARPRPTRRSPAGAAIRSTGGDSGERRFLRGVPARFCGGADGKGAAQGRACAQPRRRAGRRNTGGGGRGVGPALADPVWLLSRREDRTNRPAAAPQVAAPYGACRRQRRRQIHPTVDRALRHHERAARCSCST